MRLSLVCAAMVLAACSKDSQTLPTTPPTTNPFAITADSGISGKAVTVHTSLPVRVHVTQNSQPAAGVTVNWNLGTSGGSVSAPSSVTDASGAASVTWTVGDTARSYTLSAAISGASVGIVAIAVGGAPTALAKVSPDSNAVVAGGALSLIAKLTDKFGNGAPGVVVTWTSSAGTLSTKTTTTGTTGNAVVNFVTGAAGTYTVTATAAGIGSVTFKVVAL